MKHSFPYLVEIEASNFHMIQNGSLPQINKIRTLNFFVKYILIKLLYPLGNKFHIFFIYKYIWPICGHIYIHILYTNGNLLSGCYNTFAKNLYEIILCMR